MLLQRADSLEEVRASSAAQGRAHLVHLCGDRAERLRHAHADRVVRSHVAVGEQRVEGAAARSRRRAARGVRAATLRAKHAAARRQHGLHAAAACCSAPPELAELVDAALLRGHHARQQVRHVRRVCGRAAGARVGHRHRHPVRRQLIVRGQAGHHQQREAHARTEGVRGRCDSERAHHLLATTAAPRSRCVFPRSVAVRCALAARLARPHMRSAGR
jgi:hypothetical protein